MLNATTAVLMVVGTDNLVNFMWHSYTFFILAIGIPLICRPEWLPFTIRNMYKYGKLSEDNGTKDKAPLLIRAMRLPKWTFTHFYVFATAYHTVVAGVILWSYANGRSPQFVVAMLDVIAGRDRKPTGEPVAVIVVAALLLTQVIRRLYECKCVSVYSDGSLILPQYIVGVTFYWGASNSLIARAPGFTREGFQAETFKDLHWEWYQLLGTVLYFWGAWHQHTCFVILANLRKNSAGEVTTKQHLLPQGDWFEYLTCPHMSAEIVIYTSMNIILGFRNPLFVSLLVFVVANQLMIALLNQQWYRANFKDYPKKRKAILPFLI